MDFREKLSNFNDAHYIKKNRQKQGVSRQNPFDCKFLKIGSVIVYTQIFWSATPTALTIKGVCLMLM